MLSNQPRSDETLAYLDTAGLQLIQKKDEHRITQDALLLADFSLQAGVIGEAVDLGSGNGIVSLLLASDPQIEKVTGLELQPELVELGQRNVKLNGFENKVNICQGDWRQVRKVLKGQKFELVVANPPYWEIGKGRINPEKKRAQARHEIAGALEELVIACRYLVRPHKGYVNLIYPTQRLVELLVLLEKYQLQPKQLQFIHNNVNTQAKFFMLRATLHGQRGLQVLPPAISGLGKDSKCV